MRLKSPQLLRCPVTVPRMVIFTLSLCAVWLGGLTAHLSAEEKVLARVSTRSAGVLVGVFTSEDVKQVSLFDFQTDQNVTVPKSDVIRVEKPISLDDAAKYAGLPAVMGYQVKQLATREKLVGKVAKVTPQVVYLTLGHASGLSVGQKLTVYRKAGDVVDPDTGVVLATERPRIAEIETVEVSEKVSKAKLVGVLEVQLEVGDEVEPQAAPLVVAVCPPANNDGSPNAAGISLAEELTGALVQRGVSVVERSALEPVLAELRMQNTPLWDEASAQKLGKLTGASVVLTGKVLIEKTAGKAHVRLVDVASGKILLAVSAPVKAVSPGTSSAVPGAVIAAGDKSGMLGESLRLPREFEVNGGYQKTEEKGIRFATDSVVMRTKAFDYRPRDFVAEFLLTFAPEDRIAYIGLGPGVQDNSYNGRTDSLYLRFHGPNLAEGMVDVETFKRGNEGLGKVVSKGVHRVRIQKEGDAVSFHVDPGNDGPSDDDLELTIPDLNVRCPFFNSKNMPVFIGGQGTFIQFTITETRSAR